MMIYDLYDIRPGEAAKVTEILDCDIKQRFLDLGLIPGTRIRCVGKNPGNDMKAYLIRGAVIAIRRSDCASVRIAEKEKLTWD